MYNVLIIEDDPYYSQQLLNNISKNISDIKVFNISFSAEDSLEILKNKLVDIILLDLKLPNMSGIDIIHYLEKNNFYKYKNSIIIISGEVSYLHPLCSSSYVFSYHNKLEGYDNIIISLKQLISEKMEQHQNNTIKEKISKELRELNYNPSYNGTKYLAETIFEIFKVKDDFDGKIEKNIYSILSKRYHKTTNTIYNNIKQATNIMLLDCPEKKIISYFNYAYFIKPKIKEIIFTIINKIE